MKFMALIIIFAGSIAFGNFAPTNSERKITLTIGEDDLNNVIQTIRRSKQFGVGGILPIYNIPYGFTLNQKAEQVDVLSHGKVDVSNLFPLNAWFFEPNGLLDNVDLPLKVSLITDVGNLVHIGYKADGKPTLNFCLDVDVNVAFERTEIAKLDEILEEATQSFFSRLMPLLKVH